MVTLYKQRNRLKILDNSNLSEQSSSQEKELIILGEQLNSAFKTVIQITIPKIMEQIQNSIKDNTPFVETWGFWREYYLKQFAALEQLFESSIVRSYDKWAFLIPIMVTHHNLDRLYEVLYLELERKTINETIIPERVEDLVESLNMLIGQMRQALPKMK